MEIGLFHSAPASPWRQNPTRAIQRDLETIEFAERMGYTEAWIGEHHSSGWEIVSSPEIFIAAALERTRRIRLGTGVVSLPYHHPFHVAGRAVLLDHLAQGRFMFGVGPRLAALRRRHAGNSLEGDARADGRIVRVDPPLADLPGPTDG